MNISGLKQLLSIVNPNTSCIESTFGIASHYGVDHTGSEYCDAYIDYDKNTIKFHLYCESYHNGDYYDNKHYEFPLTKESVDLLISRLRSKAVDILEKKLREEEQNRFRVRAEKLVSDMIE